MKVSGTHLSKYHLCDIVIVKVEVINILSVCMLTWICYGKCTVIILYAEKALVATYSYWNVIILMVSFLSHQREYPKAISASHCRHHTVKLWSSPRLKPCQYKSSKMLSGICRFILPSVFNSSICSTRCCRENILKSYIAWDSTPYSDDIMFIPSLSTMGIS